MWTWMKALMSSIGSFLMPLVKKLLSRTGKLVCEVATQAVKEAAASEAETWQEKLNVGVMVAVDRLESQGLKLGVDFFLNEVIAAITAAIAKNYEEGNS